MKQQLTIASARNRFLGWPANHGLAWRWGSEVVVPYVDCAFKPYHLRNGHPVHHGRHPFDPLQPQEICLARSLDNGTTWIIEKTGFCKRASLLATRVRWLSEWQGTLPFDHPDFCLIVFYENTHHGKSAFAYSTDRGKTWSDRWLIPLEPAMGRTDYVVTDDGLLFLFTVPSQYRQSLMGEYPRHREGRVVACKMYPDSRFEMLGLVGDDPKDGFSIMPSTVRMGDVLVTALRVVSGGESKIEVYDSADGKAWNLRSTPFVGPRKIEGQGSLSSPASLVLSSNGRLVLTYADRAGARMCGKISFDQGQSWSDAIELRGPTIGDSKKGYPAGNWDFGYPRSVLLESGHILTAYYWNDDPMQERYIAGTIW